MATPAHSTPPRCIVVKVGSGVLAPDGRLEPDALTRLTDDLAAVLRSGVRTVLVSSGAVAAGFRSLGLLERPASIREQQAAAALGQPALIGAYADRLSSHSVPVAQVLLTADDLADRTRFLNARHTLETLLDAGVLPIVNENDSVAFDEIRVGDNDRLSALVAAAIDADLLVLLSVVPGLVDPETGEVVPRVTDLAVARDLIDHTTSTLGTGGMATKLEAVAIASSHAIPTVLTRGPTTEHPAPVESVLSGIGEHTRFEPDSPLSARKGWIAHASRPRGVLVIDDGAAQAITRQGASLLPKGIVSVEGRFHAGDAVDVRTQHGEPVARGLAAYASDEIDRIKGRRSDAIAGVLGYAYAEEVIHRDDLHLTGDRP